MLINGEKVKLNRNFLFTAYATLAAYSLGETIGILKEKILYALNKDVINSKRGKEKTLQNRPVVMLESKNENALSYYQSLKYIMNEEGKKVVILGFDNVSRRYKYNDLSWLWDVEFELLNNEDIEKIVLIGRFKWDVYVRLKYARIKTEKILLIDEMKNLFSKLKKDTEGTIYTMVCFDMTDIIQKLLKEEEHGNN